MPKSRGTRRRQERQRQAPLQPQAPQSRLAAFLRWLVATPLRRLEFGVSLFVGLAAIAGAVLDAFRNPDIDSLGNDPKDPFTIPFVVRNNSYLFSMRDAEFLCIPYMVTGGNNNATYGEGWVEGAFTMTIEPGESVDFRCPIGTPTSGTNDVLMLPSIKTAHIFVQVRYKTLWHERLSPKVEFTWYTATSSPRWIKGKIVPEGGPFK